MAGNGIDMKALVKSMQRADQIIGPRYQQWLLRGQNLPVPDDVMRRIAEVLTTRPRDRSASFSASSAGACRRAQIYSYLGVPQSQVVSAELMSIFNNGTWTHAKLQAAHLMAGIIDDIEIPIRWRKRRTRGTVDAAGYVPDNHPHESWRGKWFGVEYKSANSRVFAKLEEEVMSKDGPLKYARQYTRYFHIGGFDLIDVFVENKDTNRWLEWVVEPNPTWIAEDDQELIELNWNVDNRKLPDRLPECAKLMGDVFRNCNYGTKTGACAKITHYVDAEKIGVNI